MKATRKSIVSTHPWTDGCFFVYLLILFLFSQWESKYILYLWRRNSNEELWKPGNAKQCDLKELVTVTQFAQEAENVGDCAKHSRVPYCCEQEPGRRTEPLQITEVWLSKSVIGGRSIFLTKICYHRRQGYLPILVTKMNEIPTTFVSLVVKRNCTGGPRPSPLWEFRAANCFRDLIATLQNENPRRTAFV